MKPADVIAEFGFGGLAAFSTLIAAFAVYACWHASRQMADTSKAPLIVQVLWRLAIAAVIGLMATMPSVERDGAWDGMRTAGEVVSAEPEPRPWKAFTHLFIASLVPLLGGLYAARVERGE